MLNKKLVLALTAASVLGFASAASAANPGVYAGIQGGYGNINQDNLEQDDFNRASQDLVSDGFIITGQTNSGNSGGAAGRLFAGYQIDTFWGVEFGYTQFSDATYNQSFTGIFEDIGIGLENNISTKTNVVDLTIKGTLPVQNGISLYGKIGGAYVNQEITSTVTDSAAGFNSESYSKSITENKWFPTGTIGIQYEVSPQLTADLSWMHVQKTGDSNIQNLDFAGVGLAYHFG